ncbi:MAG: serine O-acetyltransferase [Actinobacteria bacterium]|nr:serine O-acetyltransferase [Actinomycetota bacterium]
MAAPGSRVRRAPFRTEKWRIESKRALPSGRRLRWRYPWFIAALLLDAGLQATLLYRLTRVLATHHLRWLAAPLHSFAKFLTHIDVSPLADIGGGLSFFHGSGAVIGKLSTLGERVTVCQGVTLGSGRPVIGDDVVLWAGAKVIGDVVVGSRSEVGANAVVRSDVPSDSIAVGVPARARPARSAAVDPRDDPTVGRG